MLIEYTTILNKIKEDIRLAWNFNDDNPIFTTNYPDTEESDKYATVKRFSDKSIDSLTILSESINWQFAF